MAEPVFRHHSDHATLDQISDLVEALPELTGAAAPETATSPSPEAPEVIEVTQVSDAADVEPKVDEPAKPAAAAPISGKEFVDEETDLIEVVDIEGELTGAPIGATEIEPDVEEYEVDFGPGVGVPDEVSASASADQAEAEATPELVEEEIPEPEPAVDEAVAASPAEEVAVEADEPVVEEAAVDEAAPPEPAVEPELAAEPAPEPAEVLEEEVADELVEITESFVGPSMGDLEQIDFFIDQELYDDAAHLLTKLEEEHGDDPEVVGRRLKLKEVGVLLEQVETVEEGSEELFADEEQYIDLAKELEAELAAEEAMVDEATGRGKGEAILEEVFREFQKGVADQLSEEDSDTHFNLGIAYREMGLLPEAIREFQVASRDPSFFVESCSIIGVCYQEQGMWSEAAEWYQKALVAPDISEDARLGLRYDLAAAYEAAGDLDQAFGLFEELHGVDPSYRDVSNRVANLTQHRQAN
jgi:tetratricopeptide (TPR) repeat protein